MGYKVKPNSYRVLKTIFFINFTEYSTDLPREAIGPQGSGVQLLGGGRGPKTISKV